MKVKRGGSVGGRHETKILEVATLHSGEERIIIREKNWGTYFYGKIVPGLGLRSFRKKKKIKGLRRDAGTGLNNTRPDHVLMPRGEGSEEAREA